MAGSKKRTSRKQEAAAPATDAPAESAAVDETAEAAQTTTNADEVATDVDARLAEIEAREAALAAQEAELAERAATVEAKATEVEEATVSFQEHVTKTEAAIEAKAKATFEEIEAAKKDNAMITTANMPGANQPEPLIIMPSSGAPKETPPVRSYKGDELGKCTRRVVSRKGIQGRAEFNLTFDVSKVYCLVLQGGEAFVPDRIAEFIRRENPGNALRVS